MSDVVMPISKRELLAYRADVKGSIFRQIRERFAHLKQTGATQKDLAIKIGMNEGQLSRRLRGDYDLRLETLSDLARGLGCRIDVKLAPLSSIPIFATDRVDTAADHGVSEAPEEAFKEKYNEMRSGALSERPVKQASKFAIELAKRSDKGRPCPINRRALGNKRLLGMRSGAHSPPWPKKSPGRIMSYASWKK